MANKVKVKSGSALRRRVAAGELERLNVAIGRDLAERLRVHCARERLSLSVAIARALASYLKP